MYVDALKDFTGGTAQSLSGTADQLSTNVYNAGSAKKAYAGSGGKSKVVVTVSAVGGTSPTFRARYVGADDAALSTNPEILADTGTSKVLAASDIPLVWELTPTDQKAAKQYYGVIYTQGGTSPTATASAQEVADAQSNLIK